MFQRSDHRRPLVASSQYAEARRPQRLAWIHDRSRRPLQGNPEVRIQNQIEADISRQEGHISASVRTASAPLHERPARSHLTQCRPASPSPARSVGAGLRRSTAFIPPRGERSAPQKPRSRSSSCAVVPSARAGVDEFKPRCCPRRGSDRLGTGAAGVRPRFSRGSAGAQSRPCSRWVSRRAWPAGSRNRASGRSDRPAPCSPCRCSRAIRPARMRPTSRCTRAWRRRRAPRR